MSSYVKKIVEEARQSSYKLANLTGVVVELKEDPSGYVIVKADKTGYNMAFTAYELEKI